METWSGVAVALALGIDGLAVGAAYGMRRIRVPARSLLIIGLCSAVCFFIAMTAGAAVGGAAGLRAPRAVGAAVFVALGLWNIGKGWAESRDKRTAAARRPDGPGTRAESVAGEGGGAVRPGRRRGAARGETAVAGDDWAALLRIHVRALGVVIQVLREPMRADVDGSGFIDAGEALVLGGALGLDALAAGFGAAFIGFGVYTVAVVAAAQLLLTWCGLRLGRAHGARWLGDKGFYVPGAILILVGLLQL